MLRTLLGLVSLLTLPAVGEAGLSKTQVLDFLKAGVHQDRVVDAVRTCGVEFRVSADVMTELTAAGSGPGLIAELMAVPQDAGPPSDLCRARFSELERAAQAQRALRRREEEARQARIRAQDYPPPIEASLIKREVSIGMTPDQVRLAWGPPERIHETITAAGRRQQWVYPGQSFLYFENGVVTAIQRTR